MEDPVFLAANISETRHKYMLFPELIRDREHAVM